MRDSVPTLSPRGTAARLTSASRVSAQPKAHLTVPAVVPASGNGPRKLVRPTMPEGTVSTRKFVQREASPMLTHQMAMGATATCHDVSHAEGFYFQKQMQTQTPMVFVLEDGERIEGCIEWYDRNSIKIRHSGRTLVYKSCIKYLYKASELRP